MIWTFFISAVLVFLFIFLKAWENKRQKSFWFFRLLTRQDYRVRHFIAWFEAKKRSLRRRIKFLLFVKIPTFIRFLLRDLYYRLSIKLRGIKDYLRGEYYNYQKGKTSSRYLREISKVKEETVLKR